MPWNGTTLYLGELGADGASASRERSRAAPDESIFQPEWSPDGARSYFVSDRRAGGTCTVRFAAARHAPLAPDGRRIRPAAMEVRHVDLRVRRPGPHRVHLFARTASDGSRRGPRERQRCAPIETPFTEIRLGARRGRPGRVPRRRAAASASCVVALDLGSRRIGSSKQSTDMLERAQLRIAEYLTRSGRSNFRPQRQDGLRPVLSAAQSRLRGARRREAAARRQVPRRPDRGRLEHARPAQPVSGPAAASRCSTSITAAAPASAAPIASGSTAAGAWSTSRTASTARSFLAEQGWSTASAASSAAAAPAATRRSRRSRSAISSRAARAITASATSRRWRATRTSSSRAISTG